MFRLSARRLAIVWAATLVLIAVGGFIAGYTQGGWTPAIGALIGGVLGFFGSALWAVEGQRREDTRRAIAARDLVLLTIPLHSLRKETAAAVTTLLPLNCCSPMRRSQDCFGHAGEISKDCGIG